MRTIKEDEELKTLVKVGDIVRLEGFTDDPIIAIVVTGKAGNCNGCALDSSDSCSVIAKDTRGKPHRISPCCIKPSWMSEPGPKFGIFKDLGKALEDL